MDGSSSRWRKSTFSGGNGDGCVEVGQDGDMIIVHDTKQHGAGPVHRYTADEWRAFIAGVRAGSFDLNESGNLP